MEQINQDNKPVGEKPEKEGGKKLFSAPDGNMYSASAEEMEKLWDVKYIEKVNEFYNDKKLEGFDNEPDTAEYKHETKEQFLKIANNSDIKKIKPEEAGGALSFMAGQMEFGPYLKVEERSDDDSETKKKNEAHYQQAKEIFMESCKKIFPEVDINKVSLVNLEMLPRKMYEEYNILSKKFDVSDVAEIAKVRDFDINKLKNIADRLEITLHMAEAGLGRKSWYNHQAKKEIKEKPQGLFVEIDKKYTNESEYKMAELTRCMYELMIIRDSVYEKLYGDKNISVEDAKKINEAREKIEKK